MDCLINRMKLAFFRGVEDEKTMTKYVNERSGLKLAASRNWMFDVEPYLRIPPKTLPEVRDDQHLKRAMQRAVRRDAAPQYLVDSIRNMIRE